MKCFWFLIPVFLICLTACENTGTASPARKKAEGGMAKYYDTSENNKDALFEAQERALKAAKEGKINLELQIALRDVQALAKSDPVKYPAADTAAEISRLYALAQEKKQHFAEAQANFRAIKQKNDNTNLAGAHKIRDALDKTYPSPPVDTTPATAAATGSAPQTPTLIDP